MQQINLEKKSGKGAVRAGGKLAWIILWMILLKS